MTIINTLAELPLVGRFFKTGAALESVNTAIECLACSEQQSTTQEELTIDPACKQSARVEDYIGALHTLKSQIWANLPDASERNGRDQQHGWHISHVKEHDDTKLIDRRLEEFSDTGAISGIKYFSEVGTGQLKAQCLDYLHIIDKIDGRWCNSSVHNNRYDKAIYIADRPTMPLLDIKLGAGSMRSLVASANITRTHEQSTIASTHINHAIEQLKGSQVANTLYPTLVKLGDISDKILHNPPIDRNKPNQLELFRNVTVDVGAYLPELRNAQTTLQNTLSNTFGGVAQTCLESAENTLEKYSQQAMKFIHEKLSMLNY